MLKKSVKPRQNVKGLGGLKGFFFQKKFFFSLQTRVLTVPAGFGRGPLSCKVPRPEESCDKFLTARGKTETPISHLAFCSGFGFFYLG